MIKNYQRKKILIHNNGLSPFITNRGPKVTMLRKLISRRRPDKATLCINVEADESADLVMVDGFWPKDIVCRKWLSRGSMKNRDTRKFHDTEYDHSYKRSNTLSRLESLCDDID